jgi:hypothetical protein
MLKRKIPYGRLRWCDLGYLGWKLTGKREKRVMRKIGCPEGCCFAGVMVQVDTDDMNLLRRRRRRLCKRSSVILMTLLKRSKYFLIV